MRSYCVFIALSSLYAQVPPSPADLKLQALGAQVADDLRLRTAPIAVPTVDAYLTRLGAQLISELPAPRPTCTFSVIANDTSGGIHEPIALPGCYIFIPAQLFLEARTESEFAGMLAHAIAHRVLNHRGIEVLYPGLIQENGLFPSGFAKEQRALEREADVIAVQSMAKAGYDPEGLVRYLERVQPPQAGAAPANSPLPDRDSRLAALRAVILSLPARTYTSGTDFQPIQQEVRRALAK
jgi:beta-barrel assembly-enhancing protease